jgi:hypothetical protein
MMGEGGWFLIKEGGKVAEYLETYAWQSLSLIWINSYCDQSALF